MQTNTTHKIPVIFDPQEHSLSCEIASLEMVLKFRGITLTEDELIKQLPVSCSNSRDAKNTWCDPEEGFVGDIDGQMPNTGYGVYEKPIFSVAIKYRPSEIITGAAFERLIDELDKNNPMVVWGVDGSGENIEWKTEDGQLIDAKMDEHARVLIGYTSNESEVTELFLLDPLYGEITMKKDQFLANWNALNKMAIVVY